MFDINVDIKKLNDPEKIAQKLRILQRKYDELETKLKFEKLNTKRFKQKYDEVKEHYTNIKPLNVIKSRKFYLNYTISNKKIKVCKYLRIYNNIPVVYAYVEKESGNVVYVGSSKNLSNRDKSHLKSNQTFFDKEYNESTKNNYGIIILAECEDLNLARIIELTFIKLFEPVYNVIGVSNETPN